MSVVLTVCIIARKRSFRFDVSAFAFVSFRRFFSVFSSFFSPRLTRVNRNGGAHGPHFPTTIQILAERSLVFIAVPYSVGKLPAGRRLSARISFFF